MTLRDELSHLNPADMAELADKVFDMVADELPIGEIVSEKHEEHYIALAALGSALEKRCRLSGAWNDRELDLITAGLGLAITAVMEISEIDHMQQYLPDVT